jgi:hypothetical protein
MVISALLLLLLSGPSASADSLPRATCSPATWKSKTLLSISNGDEEYVLPIDYTVSMTTIGSFFDSADQEMQWRRDELAECRQAKQKFDAAVAKKPPFDPVVVCTCDNTGMLVISYGMSCRQLSEDGKMKPLIKWLAFDSPAQCRAEAKRQMGLGLLFVDSKTVDRQVSPHGSAEARSTGQDNSKPTSDPTVSGNPNAVSPGAAAGQAKH